jgi:hypothetical protein
VAHTGAQEAPMHQCVQTSFYHFQRTPEVNLVLDLSTSAMTPTQLSLLKRNLIDYVSSLFTNHRTLKVNLFFVNNENGSPIGLQLRPSNFDGLITRLAQTNHKYNLQRMLEVVSKKMSRNRLSLVYLFVDNKIDQREMSSPQMQIQLAKIKLKNKLARIMPIKIGSGAFNQNLLQSIATIDLRELEPYEPLRLHRMYFYLNNVTKIVCDKLVLTPHAEKGENI